MVERYTIGVGDQLKRFLWLARLWPGGTSRCWCDRLAKLMNAAGSKSVRANADRWSALVQKSAHRMLKPFPARVRERVSLEITVERCKRLIIKSCDAVERRDDIELHQGELQGMQRFDGDGDVTVCVTYFLRPNDLRSFVASIPKNLRLLIEDTGGNLSRARNRLMERCRTKYAVIAEEDMTWRKDSNIDDAVEVLEHDPQIFMAGGNMRDPRVPWHHDFFYHYPLNGKPELHALPSEHSWMSTGRVVYQPVDLLVNWGVIDVDYARRVKWDEELEVGEHEKFFVDAKAHGRKAAFVPTCNVDHTASRPNTTYKKRRMRSKHFLDRSAQKLGVVFKPPFVAHERHGINIVVLGIGGSSTSLVTRALCKMGWHTGAVYEQYYENLEIKKLNLEMAEGKVLRDNDRKFEILANLKQPWVIKDPRFHETLRDWLPALHPYKPLLLYLTRDMAQLRSSWLSKPSDKEWIANLPLLKERCDQYYWAWPWDRVSIDVSQLTEALADYDYTKAPEIIEDVGKNKP